MTDTFETIETAEVPASKTGLDFTKINALAVISFATALAGLGIASVITGHISLAQLKKTNETGRGLALTGVILGYASIALGILAIGILITTLLLAGRESGFDGGQQMWGFESFQDGKMGGDMMGENPMNGRINILPNQSN